MRKFLLSLFVWLFWFVSFWYCWQIKNLITPVSEWNYSVSDTIDIFYNVSSTEHWVYCLQSSNFEWQDWVMYFKFWYWWILNFDYWSFITIYSNQWTPTVCFEVNQPYLLVQSEVWNFSFDYILYRLDELLLENVYTTSLECQQAFSLIPVEDVDTNYCVSNQLCPNNSWTGDFSGDLQFSNIYINDILHPWKQNIFVNIPDYIMWDYNVVGDDFNIYVGSGYDVDYINSIIDINSYRPTSSDFTNVFVGGLTLIFPYIVIVLFIVFIRKLIKRIFK